MNKLLTMIPDASSPLPSGAIPIKSRLVMQFGMLVEQQYVEPIAATKPEQVWLSVTDAAKCIGYRKSQVYKWVNDGEIPRHSPPGGRMKILRSDLELFVKGRLKGSKRG